MMEERKKKLEILFIDDIKSANNKLLSNSIKFKTAPVVLVNILSVIKN